VVTASNAEPRAWPTSYTMFAAFTGSPSGGVNVALPTVRSLPLASL
jgi:hypothetical protein